MTNQVRGRPARKFVLDESRRVIESDVDEIRVGDLMDASTWLGSAALSAIEASERDRTPNQCVVREWPHDLHWIVEASVTLDPWRARVVATDASAAITSDRVTYLGSLLHSLSNVAFALQCAVDTIDADRPDGSTMQEYLVHVRDPVARLSGTLKRMKTYLAPLRVALAPTPVKTFVEKALSNVSSLCRPSNPVPHIPRMMVLADVNQLSQTLIAMMETSRLNVPPTLEIDRVERNGRWYVQVTVISTTRDFSLPVAAWDLAGGRNLDLSLGLALGRATVLAHGGEIEAAPSGQGCIRLAFRLPILEESEST